MGVKVKTNHRVTSFDESKPSVTVDGVGELSADLVIAADGKHGHSADQRGFDSHH